MPSKWTFQIKPIRQLLDRYLADASVIVDPFSGESTLATHSNDLGRGGVDAEEWCKSLVGLQADVILFDPPYSPRQISECYKSVGKSVGMKDTQSAALYARVRPALAALLKPGGLSISFGWSSMGFGKAWPIEEIMLCAHGGAHNDTIVVVQRKPLEEHLENTSS